MRLKRQAPEGLAGGLPPSSSEERRQRDDGLMALSGLGMAEKRAMVVVAVVPSCEEARPTPVPDDGGAKQSERRERPEGIPYGSLAPLGRNQPRAWLSSALMAVWPRSC